MKSKTEGERPCSAWIDRERRVISFLKAEGFAELRFPTHDEMFAFVIEKSKSGFRIQ